ncbi:hypothetical protein NYR97_11590 [Xanthomonas hydrangeae]|uniref:Beta-hydroxyacyl-ACP dehydratase n=1 Tax=Xanthomonas hydrangeae TaxID=2775159 RepID=A0AAU0B4V1_9XANT|nr:hypothetical protein [Xanthomonas hydrangeae]WOB47936.1 hypothetical protein NYR97_11590 [Xanthomonas hydrangeae]
MSTSLALPDNALSSAVAHRPTPSAAVASVSIAYSRTEIEALIPHRGEILFLQSLTTHGDRHFTGVAYWDVDTMGLRGHFPQQAVVPAVFLVEAVAQLAGAGVLATRAAQQDTTPKVGVMMAIRRCAFRQVVHVNQQVQLDVCTRQMGEQVVMCEGTVSRDGISIASIEVLIGEVPQDVILTRKGD